MKVFKAALQAGEWRKQIRLSKTQLSSADIAPALIEEIFYVLIGSLLWLVVNKVQQCKWHKFVQFSRRRRFKLLTFAGFAWITFSMIIKLESEAYKVFSILHFNLKIFISIHGSKKKTSKNSIKQFLCPSIYQIYDFIIIHRCLQGKNSECSSLL